MKKLVIAAATISCCIANAVPAKANILSKTIANANKFCSSVVHLNNTLKQSAAPGSSGAKAFLAYVGHNNFNGFTYSELYNVSKKLGTSSDCRRMY